MGNELVSVVLPVYNVEKYLNRCVESVVQQSYRNLEIILVDDASTDSCPAICDSWAERDSRIRVIHKPQNAGLGMARNTGIENARGAYICFFDSDDYIAPDTIALAHAAAKNQNADVVCFGFHDVDAAGRILASRTPACPEAVYAGDAVQQLFLPRLIYDRPDMPDCWQLTASACMALFSMDLILQCGWRFVSERDILSEDIYSLVELYRHVRRAAALNEALYYYCRNDASLSRSYRRDRFERNVTFYRESLLLCDRLQYADDMKTRLSSYMLSNTIAAMKQLAASDEGLRSKIALMRGIMRHKIWALPRWRTVLKRETRPRGILLACILCKMPLTAYLLCRIKK